MSDTKPEWDGTDVELTLTFKVRYKVDYKSYGDCPTLEEAMEIDVLNAYDEPFLTIGMGDSDHVSEVTWRRV